MPKSPDEMAAAMIANLKKNTGKDLAQWLKIAAQSKLTRHGEIVKHLKADHGMTHGYANMIAHKALKSDAASAGSDADLVSAQYSGSKADLKPIYDTVLKIITGFGSDAVVAPKKSYVSFRRRKQFALIQPSTKTRVDLGIKLESAPSAGRLEPSGSFNAMVNHRVRLSSKSEVDAEIKKWLKAAYDEAN